MGDLPNGFTGFANRNRDPDFESAADALRRFEDELPEIAEQAAQHPERNTVLAGAFERTIAEGLDQRPPVVKPFDYAALDLLPQSDRRWAWMEVDLSAIRHNVAQVRRFLDSRCRLMAVLKADAYGHGAVEVAKAVLGAGADRLAVSTVPEGITLRKAGINQPIVILEQPPISSVPLVVGYGITPAVYEPDFAVVYGEEADRHGLKAPYHLAINTGMNRVGLLPEHAVQFLRQIDFHRALELEGVFTHFATAESPETLDFQIQTKRFLEAVNAIQSAGFDPGIVHAANSAATLRYSDVHFDMVRCGIALYGIHPCDLTRDMVDLRPAMSVHARVIDSRMLPLREGVSFGFKYRSPGSVKVCTLPIGYADGLRRCLSGSVDFILGGRYFRQVGAICMDHCMFEVDMRSRANMIRIDPQIGDEVVIVGRQDGAEITIDEHARKANTVPYEILTGFSQRMERVYV